MIEEISKHTQAERIGKVDFVNFTWFHGGSLNKSVIHYNILSGAQQIATANIEMSNWLSCAYGKGNFFQYKKNTKNCRILSKNG